LIATFQPQHLSEATRSTNSALWFTQIIKQLAAGELRLVTATEVKGAKNGPFGSRRQGPEMVSLLVKACSTSIQASSPSAQVKAAAAQVGDRNWNWEKKILCPTIGIFWVISWI
jgi:hypothetical protein